MYSEKEQAEQKLCRRYCRELRRALVCVPELRERTLAQITESMEEYLDEHPTAAHLLRRMGHLQVQKRCLAVFPFPVIPKVTFPDGAFITA